MKKSYFLAKKYLHFWFACAILYKLSERTADAPLAQLDRVFDYESKGRGFESRRAHQEGDFERSLLFLYISTLPAFYSTEASKMHDYQIRHVRDIIAHNFIHFYAPKQFKNGSKTVREKSAGNGSK